MIDTIEIMSPELTDELLLKIRSKSLELQKLDVESGEVYYRLTTRELIGSYDSKLSVRIIQGNKIKIGGSVHKFILGHNCFGGPENLKECCKYLINVVQDELDIIFPCWEDWELMRVDIAYCFDMGGQVEVEELINSLRGCTFPRKKPLNYGVNGMYFPGAATTIKIYYKGAEFKKHDLARLMKFKNIDVYAIKNIADRLVRFECEIRKRKMKYDKIDNRLKYINIDYFKKVYRDEVLKIYKEGESDMEVVKSVVEVRERLKYVYKTRKANNLFNYWSRIQIEGANTVKNNVSRMTWYRITNELADAGVSLKGNLVIKTYEENSIYKKINDFVPLPDNKYCFNNNSIDLILFTENIRLSA